MRIRHLATIFLQISLRAEIKSRVMICWTTAAGGRTAELDVHSRAPERVAGG